jgi:hypothetical protein
LNGRLALKTVAFALLVGGLASCGGDEDSSEGKSPVLVVKTSQLPRAAYIKKVNAECARLRKNLVTKASKFLTEQTGGKPEPVGSAKEEISNAEVGNAIIVPTVEREIAAIQREGAPAGDEKEIGTILASEREGIAAVRGLEKTESIRDILDRFTVATKALDRYGLDACGN